jgi:hypothetical protein
MLRFKAKPRFKLLPLDRLLSLDNLIAINQLQGVSIEADDFLACPEEPLPFSILISDQAGTLIPDLIDESLFLF